MVRHAIVIGDASRATLPRSVMTLLTRPSSARIAATCAL
jgi:hypothetical protein